MGDTLGAAWIWLILIVILIVIELATLGLTTVWFAVGAIAALVTCALGMNGLGQVIVFLAVSFILVILVRPIAQGRFNRNREKTNVGSLIGKTGVVSEAIDNMRSVGHVSVNGMEWLARTMDDGDRIEAGTLVTIAEISGVKLIVKRLESSEEG